MPVFSWFLLPRRPQVKDHGPQPYRRAPRSKSEQRRIKARRKASRR